eukprot:6228551-Prymnesium_polylepis.1
MLAAARRLGMHGRAYEARAQSERANESERERTRERAAPPAGAASRSLLSRRAVSLPSLRVLLAVKTVCLRANCVASLPFAEAFIPVIRGYLALDGPVT